MSQGLASRAFLKSAIGAARYRLTGHRAPLSVSLCVTRRCDAMCVYCNAPGARPELEAGEVLGLIDRLAALGCTRINFGGAEPLLRHELPAFLDRCREHRMWTVVETNGHALPERVDELGSVSRVMVSVDGGRDVHDRQREPGSYSKAVAGVRAARASGIPVGTVTVLTRHNACRAEPGRESSAALDAVLDMAEALGLAATFQPLAVVGPLATRAARRLMADPDDLRRTFRWLLEARQAGRRVGMSEKTLRYLMEWDDYARPMRAEAHDDLVCMAGQVSCAIDADGGVHTCFPRLGEAPTGNVRDDGFDAAFAGLADNPCRACTSTSCTEANFLYNLNTPVVAEFARVGVGTLLRGAA